MISVGQDEEAYGRLVADADAAYTGAVGRAVDLLAVGVGEEHESRLSVFRTSSADAERVHARALTAASATLEPSLAASMREIEALAASDQAAGTAFTAESNQRHEQLVADRARLMVAAMRPGSYARGWHDELMASVSRVARPAHPAAG